MSTSIAIRSIQECNNGRDCDSSTTNASAQPFKVSMFVITPLRNLSIKHNTYKKQGLVTFTFKKAVIVYRIVLLG